MPHPKNPKAANSRRTPNIPKWRPGAALHKLKPSPLGQAAFDRHQGAWIMQLSGGVRARNRLSRNPICNGAPVAQVQNHRLPGSNSRAANTLQDALGCKKPPPKPHVSIPELASAHPRRMEGHGGFAVVVTPIGRQQPARLLEYVEDRRFRERCQDAHRGTVDPYPRRAPESRLEGGFIIPVEAEYDASLHGDIVPVDTGDTFLVSLD